MKNDDTSYGRHLAEVNCIKIILDFWYDVIFYQKNALDTGWSDESVIVVSNYKDRNGKEIAEFMIEQDILDTVLAEGHSPVAIGTMSKEQVQQRLGIFDPIAATLLRTIDRLAIVVISDNIAFVHDTIF